MAIAVIASGAGTRRKVVERAIADDADAHAAGEPTVGIHAAGLEVLPGRIAEIVSESVEQAEHAGFGCRARSDARDDVGV